MSKDIREVFADNLKMYMRIAGKGQQDIIDDLGHSYYTTISQYVNGIVFPRPDRLEKLADYLGVSVEDLYSCDNSEKEDKWKEERSYYLKLTEEQLAEIEKLKKDNQNLHSVIHEVKAQRSSLYECIMRVREAGGTIKFDRL